MEKIVAAVREGEQVQKNYRRIGVLGKGATAQVYLVAEVCSGKYYAMKISDNRNALAMEAEILRKLTKEEGKGYFPEFVEYVESEGALVMEYLEGMNLQAVLDKEKAFRLEEVVGIMEEILSALDILHKQKPSIIYRDLKPANIMLCKDGSVRLIDFGAACYAQELYGQGKTGDREEETGRTIKTEEVNVKAGTYGYAAPEQFWEGVAPERACDIYSAGKVLAYLLTGKNPACPPYDVEHYCKGRKGVSQEFLKIISRSLANDPRARFEDCESMKRALCRAYAEKKHIKLFWRSVKSSIIYEKCIWKSEYRRIF